MDLSEVCGGPLGDPLGRRFSSRRLSILLPLIGLPLSLSPIFFLGGFFGAEMSTKFSNSALVKAMPEALTAVIVLQ